MAFDFDTLEKQKKTVQLPSASLHGEEAESWQLLTHGHDSEYASRLLIEFIRSMLSDPGVKSKVAQLKKQQKNGGKKEAAAQK